MHPILTCNKVRFWKYILNSDGASERELHFLQSENVGAVHREVKLCEKIFFPSFISFCGETLKRCILRGNCPPVSLFRVNLQKGAAHYMTESLFYCKSAVLPPGFARAPLFKFIEQLNNTASCLTIRILFCKNIF